MLSYRLCGKFLIAMQVNNFRNAQIYGPCRYLLHGIAPIDRVRGDFDFGVLAKPAEAPVGRGADTPPIER